MAATLHPHSELIDRVGVAALRQHFDLYPQRLYGWRHRGIPRLSRLSFARVAAEHGIAVPQDFFDFGEAAPRGRAA